MYIKNMVFIDFYTEIYTHMWSIIYFDFYILLLFALAYHYLIRLENWHLSFKVLL